MNALHHPASPTQPLPSCADLLCPRFTGLCPRSAALLEDAYQYLKWYLAGEEALARARQEVRDNMEADGDNDGIGSTRKNSNVQEVRHTGPGEFEKDHLIPVKK